MDFNKISSCSVVMIAPCLSSEDLRQFESNYPSFIATPLVMRKYVSELHIMK